MLFSIHAFLYKCLSPKFVVSTNYNCHEQPLYTGNHILKRTRFSRPDCRVGESLQDMICRVSRTNIYTFFTLPASMVWRSTIKIGCLN